MLESLGQRVATSYRVKIGGLQTRKILKKGRPQNSKDSNDYWQPAEKWDHFKICLNQRDSTGNFVIAKELMDKYGQDPRAINIVFHSNKLGDIYNDWRAAYKGRKCVCRSDDGKLAQWDTSIEARIPESIPRASDDEIQERGITARKKSVVVLRCPEEECPLCKAEPRRCKVNLILRFMILEAPAIGGAADFRATSVNSALQIRASLNQIGNITKGRFAGIPLQLKLEPRSTEHGVVHVVHIEYPQGLLDLKEEAAATGKKMLDYDAALAKILSVESHFEDEDEAARVYDEYYSDLAEKEDAIVVEGKELTETEVEEKLDEAAKTTAEKNAEAVEELWRDEKEEEPAKEEATEEPEPEEEPGDQAGIDNLF